MELTTISKKKFTVSDDGVELTFKTKHVPVILMMMQKHYGAFAQSGKFGKFKVIKGNPDTLVVKNGQKGDAKYMIMNDGHHDKLFGLESDRHIVVNEEIINELIHKIGDFFLGLHAKNKDSK